MALLRHQNKGNKEEGDKIAVRLQHAKTTRDKR